MKEVISQYFRCYLLSEVDDSKFPVAGSTVV